MMHLFKILLPFMLVTLTLANTQEDDQLIWKGAITPGGPPHIFNGTADSIYANILKMNPNYDASSCASEGPVKLPHQLNKRDGIDCNVAGDKATVRDLKTAIDRLNKIGNGQCTAAAGPKVCTRVACAYGSYVTFCNDNGGEITRNCGELGAMAQRVLDTCLPRNSDVVIGQYFNSAFNFNALVKGGGDC